MANTPKLNLLELIYDNTKKVKEFFMNEIVGKINSNNQKIDTAISEKVTQVALKSSLPVSPTTLDNLYIVYGDSNDNNGQYRWSGTTYEKISTQLNYASKSEAEAGAENTKVMTPLRVREFFLANGGGSGGVTNVVFKSGHVLYTFITTVDNTNSIVIPSETFNPTNDIIELVFDDDNQPLLLDRDYTLVGNTVTIISNEDRETSLKIGQTLHFYITNGSYDYDKLSNRPDLDLKQNKTDDTLNTTSKNIVDAINAHELDINTLSTNMEQKADKIWMPNNWKLESALPTEYPQNAETIFASTVNNFGGLSAPVVVRITRDDGSIAKQEIYRDNGNVLKYRLAVGGLSAWGEWQTVATADRTMYRYDAVNFNGGTLWSQIAWYVYRGIYTGSFYGYNATDMQGLNGFITWKCDYTASGWCHVEINDIPKNKTFFNFINISNGTWRYSTWQEIATTESGTWTPVLLGNGVQQGTFTATTQIGSFIKIGKDVRCYLRIKGTLTGATSTGAVFLANLPISPKQNSVVGYITFATILGISADWRNFYASVNTITPTISKSNHTAVIVSEILDKEIEILGSIEYEVA